MSKQINLYTPAFTRQRKPFSAIWTVAAFVATVSVIGAYYGFASWQLQALRAQRTEAAAQLKKIQDELVGSAKAAQRTGSKPLEDELARAEVLLKGRQELIGRLQGGEIGNRDGYSKYLTALARQHQEGVWLTNIEIAGARDDFAIQGRALRADLVSEYIKTLRKGEAFRGKSIGTLALHERELELKEGQGSAAGTARPAGAAQAPAVAGATAPAQPPARPTTVRFLEFVIGTGLATGAEAAGK